MQNKALLNLSNTIQSQAGSPFILNGDFLIISMNDPAVSLPSNYNSNITKAFQLHNVGDLKVTVPEQKPIWNGDNQFIMKGASLTMLKVPVNGGATLLFAVERVGEQQSLVVQISCSLPKWTWKDSFPYMDWPFQVCNVSAVNFVFSTADGRYPWSDNKGTIVKNGAVQNFFSKMPVPEVVKPYFILFNGLDVHADGMGFWGVLDFSWYDGEQVLLPSGTIRGQLNNNVFDLFYLKVSEPTIEIDIPFPEEDEKEVTPKLSISSGINIGTDTDKKAPYRLKVLIMPFGNNVFGIGLTSTGVGDPITPGSIADLVGGGTYFSAIPAILQQFLSKVELQGLSLMGNLESTPKLTSVSIMIGSAKDTFWSPIPDPTGKIDFKITEFSLVWSKSNPLDSQDLEQNFLFETQFTLLPSVFKSSDGKKDGIFTVEFNSDLQFFASFEGTVTLGDFISTLTDGAVSLPPEIMADLHDIKLNLDYNEKSFKFDSGFDVALDSGKDGALNFLKIGDQPVLSMLGGQVSIGAKRAGDSHHPSTAFMGINYEAAQKTVWKSEISGILSVGPLVAFVDVEYDGYLNPPRWNLAASLSKELDVGQVINQFFNPGEEYQFPEFLASDLKIKTFDIHGVIPSGEGNLSKTFSINTTFSWMFLFGEQEVGIDPAKITIHYDGSKEPGKEFSGLVEATWIYSAINLKLLLGYQFETTGGVSNQTMYAQWEGFRAEYQSGKKRVTFSLKGWSFGTLIQSVVRTLGDPSFVLPSPWDLLNKVSLDGLSLNLSLESNLSISQRLSASYELFSPIDLGFMKIKKLTVYRNAGDKENPRGNVKIALDAEISSVLLNSLPDDQQKKLQNITDPKTGQDVKDMPGIPGRGQAYFKLFLLVLGQRIGITGHTQYNSTKEVIAALANVPNTTGKTNPVNPKANQVLSKNGEPYYDPGSNWLIACHMGLLKVADIWTVDAMLVFNDPNLYGLRLTLGGEKAGGLAGLSIDILYKKITEDVGVFQIDFTFPDSIRNLNFGAVSVTLPQIGLKIYTNGDFFIDIGFPYNLDFRRSFSIAAIVYGVPVLGSGGFYIGKLSNSTATQVPKTDLGTFDPVMVFGIGLQLGLGYNFTKGPLSAGFSLTVFGIIEGVIACWHTYNQITESSGNKELQDSYYFKISGTVGIIGLLYGKIDFAIIQANINVKLTLSMMISYESYRTILIVARATVEISLKVNINLGLFSISVSFSFAAEVSAQLNIGSDGRAPWEKSALGEDDFMLRRALLISDGPVCARLRAQSLRPRQKRVVAPLNDTKPELTLLISPVGTVLAPEGATEYIQQESAFACIFTIDAPDATSNKEQKGSTSFDILCQSYFPWIIDTLSNSQGDLVDLKEAAKINVSNTDLESYIEKMADIDNPPLDMEGLLNFLQTSFVINIQTPQKASTNGMKENMQSGAAVFPVFDGLQLSIPSPDGTGGQKKINFETYAKSTPGYGKTVNGIFSEVEANIEYENQKMTRVAVMEETSQSMASVVFVDTFLMMGRQFIQCALNLLENYAYDLRDHGLDSIKSIMDTMNAAGNRLTPDDISIPNMDHGLTSGINLVISGLTYTIQIGDTLNKIARNYSDSEKPQRFSTLPSAIILENKMADILNPNVMLTLQGKSGLVHYKTGYGDSFKNIAATIGIELDDLAKQSILYENEDLLSSVKALKIPYFIYTTSKGVLGNEHSLDTLKSVALKFSTSVSRLGYDNQNMGGIFSPNVENGIINLANLTSLSVNKLWKAIQETGQVAQTAGMVSRFLMYGLRLPVQDGLILSDEFLYSKTQKEYGLYQLTGQQFPLPVSSSDYSIVVSRGVQSHGVDLGFIKFNGTSETKVIAHMQEAFDRIRTIIEYAKSGQFTPSPKLMIESQSTGIPKCFNIKTFSYLSSSNMAEIEAITNRNILSGDEVTQKQPMLWMLPESITGIVETRQAKLSSVFNAMEGFIGLMPEFKLQLASTPQSGGITEKKEVANWAWTTRVDFKVKKIPMGMLSSGGGNSTEPLNVSTLSNVYEVMGSSSKDSQHLQELITAMDSLGGDMISSIMLVYHDFVDSSIKLVALADTEYLAFINQTNLSTETNPELFMGKVEDENQMPKGIANPPGEFIKLLWELSVVRSGGYYLFYQLLSNGEGLPASLFDSSDEANICMIAIYNTKDTKGYMKNRLLNCINSILTNDNMDTERDVLQLESLASNALSAPLTGDETISSLSDLYGGNPGDIGNENANMELNSDRMIPVSGIIRQLRQEDIRAGNPLEHIAAYYSVGTDKQITANDIQNFNPSVPVKDGSVYYIPPFHYITAKASNPGEAPGLTFQSIAQYYGITIDEVAGMALDVIGLFKKGSIININTQIMDMQSVLGPGNISMYLERENLGLPEEDESAVYSEKYLYQMYHTLSAGFQQNKYFNKSPLSLPFGPQNHNVANDDEVNLSHARLYKRRTNRLQDGLNEDFHYKQTLGLTKYSLVDPSPSTKPKDWHNPYIGIGSVAQITLRWQDILGNTTITPFEKQSEGYKGAINGQAVKILYSDKLMGIDSWPNTKASYLYVRKNNVPALKVSLSLDASSYTVPNDRIKKELALYKLVYFQLHQDYTGLGVPGITGNPVSMSLKNTLMAHSLSTLTEEQCQIVRGFVESCALYLDTFMKGGTLPSVPEAAFYLPVAFDEIGTDNIIGLNVEFIFTRQKVLTDPAIAALEGGLSISSFILPQTDNEDTGVYTRFAQKFEIIFQSTAWYMKIGEGIKNYGEGGNQRGHQLWAVRFGKSKDVGIYFEISKNPGFYAPKPLSKRLQNKRVDIVDYLTGSTVTSNFTGVDLNLWFQSYIDAIDQFLSSKYSSPTFILDKLNGVDNPPKDGNLGKVLEAKKSLASSISSSVRPVLSTSPDDQSTIQAAKEKLRQQLLNKIGAAYKAATVVVFGLGNVSGISYNITSGPANLYGQPTVKTGNSSGNMNYTLTPAKIPIGEIYDNDSNTAYAPCLAFVLTSKNMTEESYVSLDLDYKITHLEFERRIVAGIEGYVQSRWMQFVTGPIDMHLGRKTSNIPIVNRALPIPPTILRQAAVSKDVINSASELAKWDYQFEYVYQYSPGDSVKVSIDLNYNGKGSGMKLRSGTNPDIFSTLAQFISAYPAIMEDFNKYLVKIDSKHPDEVTIEGANKAVSTFATYVGDVAQWYKNSLSKVKANENSQMPELVQISFEIALSKCDDGSARVDILNLSINGMVAKWNSENNTISNGKITLLVFSIQIDEDKYEAIPKQLDEEVSISYIFLKKSHEGNQSVSSSSVQPQYMSYCDALANPLHKVVLPEIDLLTLQNAWPQIYVERNRIMVPLEDVKNIFTTEDFLFQTPKVKLSNEMVPQLVYKQFCLNPAGSKISLQEALDGFFQRLFSHGDGTITVEVSMTGSFSYMIKPSDSGIPRIKLPINMMLPFEVAVRPDVSAIFTWQVCKKIDAWLKEHNPTKDGQPQINFGLKVFSSSSSNQPLLIIDNLYYNLT